MPITIQVTKTGPFRITGDLDQIQLIDHDGNEIPIPQGKPRISLCRCGASATKPFCDSTHSKIGFLAAEQAQREADAQSGSQPPTP